MDEAGVKAGRSRRAQWAVVGRWLVLPGNLSRQENVLVFILIFVLAGLLASAELPVFVAVPLVLPLALAATSVFVLRLRDADMRPAFVLLGLSPLLGWAALATLLTYPTAGQKNT